MERYKYYTLTSRQVLESLRVNQDEGLSLDEVRERRIKFGRNVLPKPRKLPRLVLFLRQFQSFLVYLILLAAVISIFLRRYTDAVFILIVVVINGIVAFYQEEKASNTLEHLREIVKVKTIVLREGKKIQIDEEELVPGDIIFLKAGDKIPADGRIIESRNFQTDESILTGEWLPSEKADMALKKDTSLADRVNMVYMGTIVRAGTAKVVVTATGSLTEIGKISTLVRSIEEKRTPLENKISYFSKVYGLFALILFFSFLFIGGLEHFYFTDLFITGIALAVSAIPEGLLPACTIILVLGARRILRRKGLIRNLSATEVLGSTNIILTDKTGTLTEGKMRVAHVITGEEILDSRGNDLKGVSLALKISALANEAFIENLDEATEKWRIRGRPTDKALLLASIEGGIDVRRLKSGMKKVDELLFSSERKYLASLYKSGPDYFLYLSGAPEKILSLSKYWEKEGKKYDLEAKKIYLIKNKIDQLAKEGFRIVGVGYKNIKGDLEETKISIENLSRDIIFVGLIVLKDHLRQEAKQSIETCRSMGIRPVIVTGDHLLTAQAVAKELGFKVGKSNVIEGKELDNLPEDELKKRIPNVSIYARVEPRHKLRLVKAFQEVGNVVAMTGDGVNDAPALRQADIGIALGSGTDVAKESSDLILLDNNFSTIIRAIEEGRTIFDNIRKVTIYLTADDFSEMIFISLSIFLRLPLALLPAQILLINLIEDALPSIALTMEKEEEEITRETPRKKEEPLINKKIKNWMIRTAVITGSLGFIPFFFYWHFTANIVRARTILLGITVFESLLFVFSCRSLRHSIWRRDIFSNHYLDGGVLFGILLFLLVIYVPFFREIFKVSFLVPVDWIIILLTNLAEIYLVSREKKKIFQIE